MKTVIGLFDSAADAYAAKNDLIGSGLTESKISVVTSQANKEYVASTDKGERSEAAEGAGIGAAAGALAGGAAGILASLGLLAIPGIGPILAAGPIVATLTGAGIGAAAGGLIGGLIGLGIPEHEAEVYAEGVRRGGTLLTVETADTDADRVASVLSQHNAVDIDKRASEWETAGWNRQYRETPAAPASGIDARGRGTERAETDLTSESTRRTSTSARVYPNP